MCEKPFVFKAHGVLFLNSTVAQGSPKTPGIHTHLHKIHKSGKITVTK